MAGMCCKCYGCTCAWPHVQHNICDLHPESEQRRIRELESKVKDLESTVTKQDNISADKRLEEKIDDLVRDICMHSQRDSEGVVTIVYEGLSPQATKQAIAALIKEECRLAKVQVLRDVRSMTEGLSANIASDIWDHVNGLCEELSEEDK